MSADTVVSYALELKSSPALTDLAIDLVRNLETHLILKGDELAEVFQVVTIERSHVLMRVYLRHDGDKTRSLWGPASISKNPELNGKTFFLDYSITGARLSSELRLCSNQK